VSAATQNDIHKGTAVKLDFHSIEGSDHGLLDFDIMW